MNIKSDFKSIPEDLSAEFAAELDIAIEDHLEWMRSLVRCLAHGCVNQASFGDILAPLSHTLCRFGIWFLQNKVLISFQFFQLQRWQCQPLNF
jgi:hypothetical protein